MEGRGLAWTVLLLYSVNLSTSSQFPHCLVSFPGTAVVIVHSTHDIEGL